SHDTMTARHTRSAQSHEAQNRSRSARLNFFALKEVRERLPHKAHVITGTVAMNLQVGKITLHQRETNQHRLARRDLPDKGERLHNAVQPWRCVSVSNDSSVTTLRKGCPTFSKNTKLTWRVSVIFLSSATSLASFVRDIGRLVC